MALFNGTFSSPTTAAHIYEKGPFSLDRAARRVDYRGKRLHLSAINFDYLWTLVQSAPDPVSYERLVAESTGKRLAGADPQEATRWRIQQLRKVIEDNPDRPCRLLAVPGYGYLLRV
jgi:DNA-binding response OmpR family regulator